MSHKVLFAKKGKEFTTSYDALLSRPLQRSQVGTELGSHKDGQTDDYRSHREEEVYPHHSAVGVIIRVLEGSCDDSDDDAHAVVLLVVTFRVGLLRHTHYSW